MTEREYLVSDRKDLPITVLMVAVVLVMFVGEAIVIVSDGSDYSADAVYEDGILSYSVSAKGSKVFQAVVSDGCVPTEKVLLYYDDGYPFDYVEAQSDVGASEMTPSYQLEQIAELLKIRNVTTEYVDARGLCSVMESELSAGESFTGIVCLSGVLPDTVYTGGGGDLLFRWLDCGGTLYWMGNLVGCEYGTSDGKIIEVDDYQNLWFGCECLNTDTEAEGAWSANEYASALSLCNAEIAYGVNPTLLTDRTVLSIGYENRGYASIAAVGFGTGSVVIFAGDYSKYQRFDVAQVVASGIGPDSGLVGCIEGTVSGTSGGSMEIHGTGLSVYVYIGRYFPVFGERFCL